MSDGKDGQKKYPALYILLISVHGLIRGNKPELGRDADTGGQVKYVLELACALGRRPEVAQVDLLTRRVVDPQVAVDYAQPVEEIGDGVSIIRIDAGPDEYIPKEQLWDYLENFSDNAVNHLRCTNRQPDLIHSHYADAGYVGSKLANLFGTPLIHTGHSLGRVKRQRLLAAGLDAETIEEKFNLSRRIDAEELTLASAERVITSTHQEVEKQYQWYDFYYPDQMRVIPPGTDLDSFFQPRGDEGQSAIAGEIQRFLKDTDKPIILALSRPDARKNIGALIAAFGESDKLRKLANLVIIVGNRDDITDMVDAAREVLVEILLLIDRYDLYGQVAYPKHHTVDDVSLIYRLAAGNGGVFVNPALTEPFGLTLLEAAACGLPLVATEDGGPRDIIENCGNGVLIDPQNTSGIADAILQLLSNREIWETYSTNGLQGVRRYYSWEAHVERYLKVVQPIVERDQKLVPVLRTRREIQYKDKALFSDLDQNLLGDSESLARLVKILRQNINDITFGIATGRRLDSALTVMKKNSIPQPDVLITSSGTEIYHAPELTRDSYWLNHIDFNWTPRKVRQVLDGLPGLELQPRTEQSSFKISYYIDLAIAPGLEEIQSLLYQAEQTVNLIQSFGQFLDIVPIRASKGFALRYFADRWNIPLNRIIVAGGSGADEDMMRGNTLAVMVANRHEEELSQLDAIEQIYFAESPFAKGILEALEYYDFFNSCAPPATA